MEFLNAIAPLAKLADAPIGILAGVFMRLSGLVFFLPGLGEQTVSPRVRLGAAFAGAMILTPLVLSAHPASPATPSGIVAVMASEALCGAIIGLSLRAAIFALQITGVIIAQSMSLTQAFNPGFNGEAESETATLLTFAGTALALSAGLHVEAIKALALSYDVMPYGVFPGGSDAGEWAASRAAFAFATGFALSTPFAILAFIYNLAIGAANRAMPSLSVAFIGSPAITFGSLLLLAVGVTPLLSTWIEILSKTIATVEGGGGL